MNLYSQDMIEIHRPYLGEEELQYVKEVILSRKLSSQGKFSQLLKAHFEELLKPASVWLTQSCTDALEMSAILSRVGPGDEVIVPSYGYTSTANAFILRGANVVFADSNELNPNVDINTILRKANSKTKVVVLIHYAGIPVDMDPIIGWARENNILIIEDAAQAYGSYYKHKACGSIGDLGAYSFHETKPFQCGEGGALVVNSSEFIERSAFILEKGTNRIAYMNNALAKYEWVDIGSSFAMSELHAAVLWAQVQRRDKIIEERKQLFETYMNVLKPLEKTGALLLPFPIDGSNVNLAHFYVVLDSGQRRNALQLFLKERKINSTFHFLALHKSPYCLKSKQVTHDCHLSEKYEAGLLRIPFYNGLMPTEMEFIGEQIHQFFVS